MYGRLPAMVTRATVVAACAAVFATLPAQAPPPPPALTALTSTAPAALQSSAVRNALSKVGAPYRSGAAGPSAFDCSGLVNWSYRTAGKSLPRTSQALAHVGAPVSRSDLQPGDLVFFYQPIHHVGIYVGNGQIVHASNSRSPVKVSGMGGMPFTTARRV